MRIGLLSAIIATAISTAATAQNASPFAWDKDGAIRVNGICFRVTQMDKNWNATAQNAKNTIWQENRANGNTRSGIFKTPSGEFTIRETVDLRTDNQAKIEIELESAAGITCNQLVLSSALPVKQFSAAPLTFNGRDVRFKPAFDPKDWMASSKNGKTSVELSLPGGKLTIKGNFIAGLQDNRRFDADFWDLRLSFAPSTGLIKQTKFSCEMVFTPFTATAVDLRQTANMGFADAVADDRKGGWTDQGPDNDLRMMPTGKQKFAGVEFNIIDPAGNQGKSCLVLRGKERPYFPASAEIILPKPTTAKYLYLLHAIAWEPHAPTEIGEISCEFVTNSYVDRSCKRFPVNSGIDVANFWYPHQLRRAVSGWQGRNQTSPVGLYVTRFDLTNEPLQRITIESRNNAVWMIAGISLSDFSAQNDGATGPFVMKANNEWFPVANRRPIVPGSILDFSEMQDVPAGKYGYLKNVGGELRFEKNPDRTARFYGANIALSANFLDHQWSDRLAAEFAAIGYNIARLHHFDMKLSRKNGNSSTALEPVLLDKMEYLVHALKQHGVYITLDLFTLRTTAKGEIPEFPDRAITPHEFKALAFINDNVMKNWEEFSANLLNHVNPYTGLAWKNDPAIVSISLINENTIFSTVPRTPWIENIYKKKFDEYVKERGITLTGQNRENHWKNFLSGIYLKGLDRMLAFMRKQGVKAQITDQNFWCNIATTLMRPNYDLVDNHFYWGHPVFLGKSWSLPLAVTNDNPIGSYAGELNAMFPTRLIGKPFSVTEWDFVNPNEYSSGGAFLMGAYSALQDWSILCRFAYAHSDARVTQDNSPIALFDVAGDPLRLLSERAGALFFRRGDVKKSEVWYPFLVSSNHLNKATARDEYPTAIIRLGLIGRTGSIIAAPDARPQLPAGTRAVIGLEPSWQTGVPYIAATDTHDTLRKLLQTGAVTPALLDLEHNRFTSSTGELILDRNNGTFTVKTPCSEGFLLNADQELSGAFTGVKNRLAPAAILVAARDGKPLAESNRLLILHLTDTKNTGLTFQDAAHTTVLDWGKTPLLIRRGRAELTLRRDLSGFRLHAAGFDGQRQATLPLKCENGQTSMTLDTVNDTKICAAYELIKE